MRSWKTVLIMLSIATALLLPSAAFAAKKYQVTGSLKIGEKVTIEYKMIADNLEVKKAK